MANTDDCIYRITIGVVHDEGYATCEEVDSDFFYMEIHAKTENEAISIAEFLKEFYSEDLESGKMAIKLEIFPLLTFDDVFNYFIKKSFGNNGDYNLIN